MCGQNSNQNAPATATIIDDQSHDPRISQVVAAHLSELGRAGVTRITLSSVPVYHMAFLPDNQPRTAYDADGHSAIRNGGNRGSMKMDDGREVQGRFVENGYIATLAMVTPSGENSKKSNPVLRAIGDDLKNKGIELVGYPRLDRSKCGGMWETEEDTSPISFHGVGSRRINPNARWGN